MNKKFTWFANILYKVSKRLTGKKSIKSNFIVSKSGAVPKFSLVISLCFITVTYSTKLFAAIIINTCSGNWISTTTSSTYSIVSVNTGNVSSYDVMVPGSQNCTLPSTPLSPIANIYLGSAANYVMFTSVGAVGNTGISQVTGDIGTNLGAITGFDPPSSVNGTIHNTDASTAQCITDL